MQELVNRVIAKERKAEIELYKIVENKIEPALYKYVKCKQSRFDVKQNILIKVFTKLHTYNQEKGLLLKWVFKIAYNECMKHYNKVSKRKEAYIVDDDVYWL